MTLLLGLSTPETVLMVVTSEGSACVEHRALVTHRARHRLASLSGLWSLSDGREEDLSEAATLRSVHPGVIGSLASREIVDRHPLDPFP